MFANRPEDVALGRLFVCSSDQNFAAACNLPQFVLSCFYPIYPAGLLCRGKVRSVRNENRADRPCLPQGADVAVLHRLCPDSVQNELIATGVTGKVVHDACGLQVRCLYPGRSGGAEQLAAMIAYGEVDMLLFFRDPVGARPGEPNDMMLLRVCDVHTIPVATNIATAEVLIHGLERGDLAWLELRRDR